MRHVLLPTPRPTLWPLCRKNRRRQAWLIRMILCVATKVLLPNYTIAVVSTICTFRYVSALVVPSVYACVSRVGVNPAQPGVRLNSVLGLVEARVLIGPKLYSVATRGIRCEGTVLEVE